MKSKTFRLIRHGLLCVLPLLALTLGGCALFATKNNADVMTPPSSKDTGTGSIARLHIGDTVAIIFSGLPTEDYPPQEKPIKEDGTISLPDIGRVKAAGKTPGELEDAIHDLYVPKFVTHLNVTVKTSGDRVYFVRGEVKAPGRMLYTGSITVSRAIASAGDFTDFADRGSVFLTRADGRRFELNLKRILAGRDPDPPVFPGDQIEVSRRLF
jgi:polysaccharide export outer membrane protein